MFASEKAEGAGMIAKVFPGSRIQDPRRHQYQEQQDCHYHWSYHVLRDGEPVIEVRPLFCTDVVSPDYENAFRVVDEPDDVFKLNDASPVGVLQDKESNHWDKDAKSLSLVAKLISAFRLGPLLGLLCVVVRLIPESLCAWIFSLFIEFAFCFRLVALC